jgi:hypothetical protein
MIAGEVPTMRNSSPSKLAKMLAMDRVFFREFQINGASGEIPVSPQNLPDF